MTNAAVSLENVHPLLDLVERHFKPAALDASLELGGAAVPWKLWESSLYEPLRDLLARPGKELRAHLVEAGWELGGGHRTGARRARLAGGAAARRFARHRRHRRRLGVPARQARAARHPRRADRAQCWQPALLPAARADRAAGARSRAGPGAPPALHDGGRALPPRPGAGSVRAARRSRAARRARRGARGDHAEDRQPDGARRVARRRHGGGGPGAPADARRSSAASSAWGCRCSTILGGITSQRRRAKGHEDLVGGRLTWPWAWLAASLAAGRWRELRVLATSVERFGTHPETLAEAMRPLLGDLPRSAIRARLRDAHTRLQTEVGPGRTLHALAGEIEMLEASYE